MSLTVFRICAVRPRCLSDVTMPITVGMLIIILVVLEIILESLMPSPKTLEIQESKAVQSKAHWFWVSTKLELIDGRWVKSRGLTYRKADK